MLGPCGSHVDKPLRFLDPGLSLPLSGIGPLFPERKAEIELPLTVLVVEHGQLLCSAVLRLLPEIGHDHAGKLEPLGRVDRVDLDGVGVALHPPGDELVLRVRGGQSAENRQGPLGRTTLAGAGRVHQLDHVQEVGNVSLPVLALGNALHHGFIGLDRRPEGGDTFFHKDRRQLEQLVLDEFDFATVLVGEPAHLGKRVAEEDGGGGPPYPAQIRRPLHRLEQRADVEGHAAGHHAGGASRDGRDFGPNECLLNELADAAGANKDADVFGGERTAGGVRACLVGQPGAVEQLEHLAENGLGERALIGSNAEIDELDAAGHALNQSRLVRLRGIDTLILDPRPKLPALESVIQAVEHGLVGTEVDDKRTVDGLRLLNMLHIRPHIGPAKPVDRLLGIADTDQPPAVTTGKEPVEKLPLLLVGVLGLVHDRQRETILEGRQKTGPLADQLAGDAEQVVVARGGRHRRLYPLDSLFEVRQELREETAFVV